MGTVTNILVGAGSLAVNGTDVGFTSGGVRLRKIEDGWLRPDFNRMGYSEKVKLNEAFIISVQLAEATQDNLKTAWDLQTSDLQASGVESYRFGGHSDVSTHALIFTGKAPGANKTRTITFFRCVSVEFGEIRKRKGVETLIPATFHILADSSKSAKYSMGEISDET